MIDGKNIFDQPINSDWETYENILDVSQVTVKNL